METNDITVRPAKRQVVLGDGFIHNYGRTNLQQSAPRHVVP